MAFNGPYPTVFSGNTAAMDLPADPGDAELNCAGGAVVGCQVVGGRRAVHQGLKVGGRSVGGGVVENALRAIDPG